MPKRDKQIVSTMKDAELTALDDWARLQDFSRADAIRRLIRLGIDEHERRERRTRNRS